VKDSFSKIYPAAKAPQEGNRSKQQQPPQQSSYQSFPFLRQEGDITSAQNEKQHGDPDIQNIHCLILLGEPAAEATIESW
jgi:hypothetical protein